MGNTAWRKYDGEEPIEAFLNRNRPSQVQNTEAAWIYVPCRQREHEEEQDEGKNASCSSMMMAEWKGLEKSVKNVCAETLKDLAVKYKHTTGKWMIFAKSDQIDELWFAVAKAVVAGKLGDAAKVSPRKPDTTHVICIYTKDFTDEEDVRRVEKGLRDAGIHVGMQYKPDIYTTLNIYAKNKFGIPASVYKSPAVKKG